MIARRRGAKLIAFEMGKRAEASAHSPVSRNRLWLESADKGGEKSRRCDGRHAGDENDRLFELSALLVKAR